MAVNEIHDILDRLDAALEAMTVELDSPSRLETAAEILAQFSGSALIQKMVTECGERLGSDFCAMTLLDDTTQHIIASSVPMLACAREHSYCQYVIASGRPMDIPNVRLSLLLLRQPRFAGVAAYLGVPVLAPNGEKLGALCVIQSKPRKWTAEERELLEGYSQQITAVLEEDAL